MRIEFVFGNILFIKSYSIAVLNKGTYGIMQNKKKNFIYLGRKNNYIFFIVSLRPTLKNA